MGSCDKMQDAAAKDHQPAFIYSFACILIFLLQTVIALRWRHCASSVEVV